MPVSNNFLIATLNLCGMAQRKKQLFPKRLLNEQCIDIVDVEESKFSGNNRIEWARAISIVLRNLCHARGRKNGRLFSVSEEGFAIFGN